MENIKFKQLDTDNLFDFCDVIGAIGIDKIAAAIGKDGIDAIMGADNLNDIGIATITKIVPVLIKNVSTARNEIVKFFAGCTVNEQGTAITAEEIRRLSPVKFIQLIRDFAKLDDLSDFFQGVAELINSGQIDSANSSTDDIQSPAAI